MTLHSLCASGRWRPRLTLLGCLLALVWVPVSLAETPRAGSAWWSKALKGWVIHRVSDKGEIYAERRPLGQPRSACDGTVTGPALAVGCRGGRFVAYLHLLGADVWTDEDERTEVVLRLDGEPGEVARARLTPRGVSSGFSFEEPELVIRSMALRTRVSIRYRSRCWDGSAPTSELTFDVRGLGTALNELAGEGCHLKAAARVPRPSSNLALDATPRPSDANEAAVLLHGLDRAPR